MAAGNETFKAFLLKKKTEYRLRFPFLKENQVVAKLKKIWLNKRVSQKAPELTRNEEGDPDDKPKTGKPRRSRAKEGLLQGCTPKCAEVSVSSECRMAQAGPLRELTPNTPTGGHGPGMGSASLWDVPTGVSPVGDGWPCKGNGWPCEGNGWPCEHPGVEALSGDRPVGDLLLTVEAMSSGRSYEAAEAVDCESSWAEAVNGAGVAMASHGRECPTAPLQAASHNCGASVLSYDTTKEEVSPSLMEASGDITPPPVTSEDSEHAALPPLGEQEAPPTSGHPEGQQESPRPSRRSRVCRDWRRGGDVGTPDVQLSGEGDVMQLLRGEGDTSAGTLPVDSCVSAKDTQDGGFPLSAAAEVRSGDSIPSCDKGPDALPQNVVCDMFVALLPTNQNTVDESALHRRVFRSAPQEGASNFCTMFSDDSDIFF